MVFASKLDQIGMDKTSVGQENNPLSPGQDQCSLSQDAFVVLVANRGAVVFDNPPGYWNSPPAIDEGQTDENVPIVQVGRVYGQVHGLI